MYIIKWSETVKKGKYIEFEPYLVKNHFLLESLKVYVFIFYLDPKKPMKSLFHRKNHIYHQSIDETIFDFKI